MSLMSDLADDIKRNLQKVYERCVRPWKARTLEDALQIFRKTLDSQPITASQLSSSLFNALADIVSAILDSGTIQHQRLELQRDLAIDLTKEALTIWDKSGLFEGTSEWTHGKALLQYLAGTATAEQVSRDSVRHNTCGLTSARIGRARHAVHQESAITLTAAVGTYGAYHSQLKSGKICCGESAVHSPAVRASTNLA